MHAMQYPLIQFYKGSLVKLASGQLKNVEDLSSDDFLESVRLTSTQIDSSVVKDFLEVSSNSSSTATSPNQTPTFEPNLFAQQQQQQTQNLQLHQQQQQLVHQQQLDLNNNSSSSINIIQANSNALLTPQINDSTKLNNLKLSNANSNSSLSLADSDTVVIKFFLENCRRIVFVEVPVEHPFFVFHRGWSSWNPQKTFDKFSLKCRKLKIGDTCISRISNDQSNKNSNNIKGSSNLQTTSNGSPLSHQQSPLPTNEDYNFLMSTIKLE